MPFSAAEGEKKTNTHTKKKKVGKSIGDPVRGRDAPINVRKVNIGHGGTFTYSGQEEILIRLDNLLSNSCKS